MKAMVFFDVLVVMLVTIKFRLDHTWDEYKGVDKELLLEDMMDRITSMKEGIEPIEIESIEYGND